LAVGWCVLVGLVLFIVSVPFVDDHSQFPPLPFSLGMIAFGAVAVTTVVGRLHGGVVLSLGVVAMSWMILDGGESSERAHIVPGLLLAVSSVAAAANIARVALSNRTHREARILHGVSSYILIGVAYALLHQRMELLVPGSYVVTPGHGSPPHGGWADYLWLSFSVMTTSGFTSEVTPVGSAARALCTMEAITGVMFPAIFIARLVSTATEEEKGTA
jgi:hypothetical protein